MADIITLSPSQISTRSIINRVYGWMTFGLLVTGWVAKAVSQNESFIRYMMENIWLFYGLLIAEVVLVIWLSRGIQSMSSQTATFVFLTYAALNGFTLSMIFLVYTASSIASTFFVTAGMFGAMSFYGYTTKRDLTGLGSFFLMALIGLILASIVNLFWANSMLYWAITYAGVIIFTGLTAYDVQKIKNTNTFAEGSEEEGKIAILGALTLYLDFVNMFLYMLRILGKRK